MNNSTGQKFIESGNLEAYFWGRLNTEEQQQVVEMCALFPEVKQEFQELEQFMHNFTSTFAVAPRPGLKHTILRQLIPEDYAHFDLSDLPVIDADTDYTEWLAALASLIPDNPADDLVFIPLTEKAEVTQSLVFTRMSIPEETHEDLIESFFILQGTCVCMVDGSEHILGPGDFLEIPLYVNHDIKLTSKHVLAILQQQPLAV